MEYQLLSLEELSRVLPTLHGWEMRDGWLRKRYHTPGWSHTMMLVQTLGYLAEAAYHHPDLEVGYASVVVKLQTHKVKGITHHDLELAKKYDEVVLWKPIEGDALDGFPKKWVH
ncbi:MAG TPA: 4a-hydroxytetrahydrobiopterin dehydratase [Pirellulales bacterium]